MDHLGGVALVRLTETKPRERELTSFVPCLQKNLYGATEEKFVVISITALRGSGKSRSLAQNVLTDSYLPRTEEERLALNKVKDSLKYEKGRYRVGVPWKDEKHELPGTKSMALSRLRSTQRNLEKDDRVAEDNSGAPYSYRKKMETHELIFSW